MAEIPWIVDSKARQDEDRETAIRLVAGLAVDFPYSDARPEVVRLHQIAIDAYLFSNAPDLEHGQRLAAAINEVVNWTV